MPSPDLQTLLRTRLLEAAIAHPNLQVVMYTGRPEAFPPELIDDRHDLVRWPLVKPTRLTPAHVAIASIHQRDSGRTQIRTEILALFGDQAGMETFDRLARASMDACAAYRTVDNYRLAAKNRPAIAWARWLFETQDELLERHVVGWHQARPTRFASAKLDNHRYDPLEDRVRHLLPDQSIREWGCAATTFTKSVFTVSANAVSSVNTRGFLGLTIDVDFRRVSRINAEASFGRKDRAWALFHCLFQAGEEGLSRGDLMPAVFQGKAVHESNLDKQKQVVDRLLLPLDTEVKANNRGIWRLGLLDMS